MLKLALVMVLGVVTVLFAQDPGKQKQADAQRKKPAAKQGTGGKAWHSCAMRPQLRFLRNGKCPFCRMDLFGLVPPLAEKAKLPPFPRDKAKWTIRGKVKADVMLRPTAPRPQRFIGKATGRNS